MNLLIAILVGLFAGFLAIPLYIGLFKAALVKSILGKGMFILGQLANGGSMAYLRDSGEVDLVPLDTDRNAVFVDGDWIDLEEDQTIYRMGWAPFAISWEKTKQSIGQFGTNLGDVEGEGEYALLNDTRGGYQTFTDCINTDGHIIDILRLQQSLGRTGNRLLNRAEEVALRKYAGEDQMNQMKFAMLLTVSWIVVFAMTWFFLTM